MTGAVGVTVRGPTKGKPVLVTSFNEFQQIFGGFLPEPPRSIKVNWEDKRLQRGIWWRFPNAVRGFFDNGGQQLYVKRVVAARENRAQAANKTLEQGVVSEIVVSDADRNATRITVRHVLGIDTDANKAVTVKNGQTHNDILVTEAVAYQIGSTESVVGLRGSSATITVFLAGGAFCLCVLLQPTSVSGSLPAPRAGGVSISRCLVRPVVGDTLQLLHFDGGPDSEPGSGAVAEKSDPPTGGASRSVKLKAGFKLKAGDRVRVNDHKYDLSNPSEGVDEVQELSFPGTAPTSGTFTLTFDGQTAAGRSLLTLTVQRWLPRWRRCRTSVPGTFTMSGGPFPAAISVTFTSTLGKPRRPGSDGHRCRLESGHTAGGRCYNGGPTPGEI